jgi:hypothetical protein
VKLPVLSGPCLILVALADVSRADPGGLRVVLEGDPALVAALGADLARRGVASASPGDGQVVRVTVAPAPDGIALELRDPGGRAAAPVVSTIATASALVESWLRPELADPLLAPRPPRLTAAPVDVVQAPAPPPASPSPWTPVLRLGGATSPGWERSLRVGASAGASARLGAVSLGPELGVGRFTDRGERVFLPRRPPDQSPIRWEWSALLAAELPLVVVRGAAVGARRGQPSLVLGLAAGAGRQSGDQGIRPRGEIRASLVIPLRSQLALEGGVTAVLAPAPARSAGADSLRVGVAMRWGLP